MLWRWIRVLASTTLLLSGAQAQNQAQSGAPATIKGNESETSTRDIDAEIKVRVNLVLVRAVVKDAAGKIVPDLKQEDFQVFDNGKPQKISSFNVETAETPAKAAAPPAEVKVAESVPEKQPKTESAAGVVNASVIPKRFVALVFDDSHMKLADAMAVHAATEKLFASLTPTDRVAIYSTQGNVQQEFTDDAATLRKTLAAIVPHTSIDEGHQECPDISYYQADLIENHHDEEAIAAANADAVVNGCPTNLIGTAQRILDEGDLQTETTYQNLGSIVRKLESMPGQRVLVYVSPGFLVGQSVFGNSWDWIEKALGAGVVVNTIDARGLYTPNGLGDIDAAPQHPATMADLISDAGMDYQRMEGRCRMQMQFEQGQVLASMAANTGGTYFHNRNDLSKGLSQALAEPSVSYVLGFRPENATADGKFHNLKVALTNGKKYQIQARNGYFARKKLNDPEEEAKEEVREALFSNDEIASLPMQLNTQLLSINETTTQLTVLTRLDIHGLRFRKADGRNRDNVVLATAVFDRNGQLVDGQMKEIALRLQDATVKRLSQSGLTFKSVFTVKPGTYNVRSVVQSSEGDQVWARNLPTVIP
jgi:VWFA-related protein